MRDTHHNSSNLITKRIPQSTTEPFAEFIKFVPVVGLVSMEAPAPGVPSPMTSDGFVIPVRPFVLLGDIKQYGSLKRGIVVDEYVNVRAEFEGLRLNFKVQEGPVPDDPEFIRVYPRLEPRGVDPSASATGLMPA